MGEHRWLWLILPPGGIGAVGAPHHGGRTANPAMLYAWAWTKAVVVSQRSPTYGTTDAMTPLERSGIPLGRTWQCGAGRFRWTSDRIITQAFLDQAGTSQARGGRAENAGSVRLAAVLPLSFATVTASGSGRVAIGLLGFVLGLVLTIVLAIIEFAAWALIVPPRVPESREPAEPPEPSNGEPEQPGSSIAIAARDGIRMVGRWSAAERTAPTGRTVILLHGFAEPPGSVRSPRVAPLTRAGWNVAALDLRGYGQSGGLYASFGGREAGDVHAWIEHISKSPDAAAAFTPVLWGRSMGAAIALRAAAEDPRVRALVLESPMVDLDEALAVWFRKRRLPFAHLLARLVTARASKLAGVSLIRPRPLDLAPRVQCPVLILHGADDSLVSSSLARRLAEAFPGAPRFIEVPGAGHADVITIGGEPVLEQVMRFLGEAIA
jgi:pimeloyl-ACP methyl ester carboxylesterase